MSNQKLIKEYPGIISEIQTEIKKLENDTRVLNKLYVILDVLHDVPIKEIIKKHNISQGTAYNWIRQWNEGGIESLKRKKGSKGQSKLTDEQFMILDKIIQEKNLKTSKEVKHIIEVVFGVKYSIRQIERIMKKLGYTYTKPFKIYSQMPKDAEIRIKKNAKNINTKKYTLLFLDQTFCQNQQPTERICANAVGIQAVNGNSFIAFLDNTRTYEMMKFIITAVIENINNEDLKYRLKQIINDEKLNLDNILKTINKKENYDKIIDTIENLSKSNKTTLNIYKRLKKNPLNFKTKSKTTLENLQKIMLLSLVSDEKIQQDLKKEKPIAIVLDNYSVHHALFFTELCLMLNIELIYLPPYSPKYNPIEQVWRTIKATISRKYITSVEELKFIFKTEFNKVVNNQSYWENWVKKFL